MFIGNIITNFSSFLTLVYIFLVARNSWGGMCCQDIKSCSSNDSQAKLLSPKTSLEVMKKEECVWPFI